ncbi:MAG: RidA family protein [Ilumatobacter sp.]|uniref:RidA family protein n=1 Tax=Ilumatobacter sp. TaxID=1967498 RepID=UPI00261ED06E|nr:RidA family protein [Ilumatobacter sp.]MDJ0770739.1 RidA family protein [Ilumatobacter sp.]
MSERGPIIPPGSEPFYERFHFAPAFRVGNAVYVSGVIGTGDDGSVPDDAAAEFTQAFANLGATLEAAGTSLADVVDMTSFHVDMSETLGSFMAARDAAMTAPWPAWTAIGCTELAIPGARAEVKVTAVLPE